MEMQESNECSAQYEWKKFFSHLTTVKQNFYSQTKKEKFNLIKVSIEQTKKIFQRKKTIDDRLKQSN